MTKYIFASCLFAAFAAVAPADNPVTLVRGGSAMSYIVMDTNADVRNREVVDDFIAIVQRMSGAVIGFDPVAGYTALYIGEAREFPALGFSVEPLAPEEFIIRTGPDGVYILGGSALGTSHGVYTLLRQLGCRWIMPGAIGECLPKTADINLAAMNLRDAPDFTFRDIWYAYGCSPEGSARRSEWLRRNRMYRPPVQHGHNLTNTLGVFAPFEDRPDLYALVHGERSKQQICTSNPEVVALVVKAIKQHMRTAPDTIAYSLCPDDNHDFCECDQCTALDSGAIDSGGLPSIADRYQVFLNQVFDGLRDEYPKLQLTTYSYNLNHTDPPVNTPVDPNTCIFATTSVYCSAHGIGDAFCPSRQAFKALLQMWTSLTKHVHIYEYDPVPYSGGLPWPMWEGHVREMAAYRDIGVTGVSFEGQDSWAAYFPNYYIAAQCMWDADQNGATLFDDMLRSFFGNAAPDMARYYESLATVFRGLEKKVEWGLADYPKYFPPAMVEECRSALAAADAREVDPIVKDRLAMVRLSFDEMDAYLNIRRAGSDMSYEDYQREVTRLNDTIDKMASINEDYLLANIAKEKTSAGIADRFAREQGFINQWLLCGPFDNTGMDGHDRVYPPEEKIDLTAQYDGKGGVKVGWKPNQTPEWTGYVDLLNEFQDTDWVVAYALCWVRVESGPKDVLFRMGSNDSIKVFVNGGEVWNNKVQRIALIDEDVVPVTLPEGYSTILLKIGQSGSNWGFNFRISQLDSEAPPKGITVSITPPEN